MKNTFLCLLILWLLEGPTNSIPIGKFCNVMGPVKIELENKSTNLLKGKLSKKRLNFSIKKKRSSGFFL